MRTIETTATVAPDRTLTVQLPDDVEPGEHRVVLVIDEQLARAGGPPSLKLPVYDVGEWPEDLPLRREEMYDDWGR